MLTGSASQIELIGRLIKKQLVANENFAAGFGEEAGIGCHDQSVLPRGAAPLKFEI